MTRLRPVLAAVVLAAAVTWHAAPASALSCVEPADVIADASHVFAGTIAGGDEAHLTMDVAEVWSADPVLEQLRLPLEVEMGIWYPWDAGDPPVDPDRVWVVATRGDFVVGPCGIWPQEQVESLRPRRTTAPVRAVVEQLPDQVIDEATDQATAPAPVVEERVVADEGDRSTVAAAATIGGLALAGAGAWWVVVRRRRGRRGVTG